MSGIIAAGTPVPELSLRTADGESFTEQDLLGKTTVLVFFPFAFSPVCTDQFQIYEQRAGELGDAVLYGVSTDPSPSLEAFREKLGVEFEMLSDFEPKGATAKELGTYFEPAGMTNRALVVVGPDGVVTWSYLASSPGELPPFELVLEGLAAARA